MEIHIDERKEETFFELHFDFGDEPDTVADNLKTALNIFSEAYRKTVAFAENAEDGEVFDAELAAVAFDELALSFKYCLLFMKELDSGLQMKVVKEAEEGSMQDYINKVMKSLI